MKCPDCASNVTDVPYGFSPVNPDGSNHDAAGCIAALKQAWAAERIRRASEQAENTTLKAALARAQRDRDDWKRAHAEQVLQLADESMARIAAEQQLEAQAETARLRQQLTEALADSEQADAYRRDAEQTHRRLETDLRTQEPAAGTHCQGVLPGATACRLSWRNGASVNGPGRYDDVCTAAREQTGAAGVVLLVIGGRVGSGFSVQALPEITAALPELLRNVAAEIEASGPMTGVPHFECPQCKKVSYNPHDVEHRYCGWCHVFHE